MRFTISCARRDLALVAALLSTSLVVCLWLVATLTTPESPPQTGTYASAVFFTSLVLAPLWAAVGVWQRSAWTLVASALLSIPSALILFGYPSILRLFVLLPLLHLAAAAALASTRRSVQWLAWLALAMPVALLLVWRFSLPASGL